MKLFLFTFLLLTCSPLLASAQTTGADAATIIDLEDQILVNGRLDTTEPLAIHLNGGERELVQGRLSELARRLHLERGFHIGVTFTFDRATRTYGASIEVFSFVERAGGDRPAQLRCYADMIVIPVGTGDPALEANHRHARGDRPTTAIDEALRVGVAVCGVSTLL